MDQFTGEDQHVEVKIRIVLAGLRGGDSIARAAD
jgi:hypothetical protein